MDRPDFALYDEGDFVAVLGEVKRPEIEITEMAASTDRNKGGHLAALLIHHQQLNQLYGAASALSLTAEDLGLRA